MEGSVTQAQVALNASALRACLAAGVELSDLNELDAVLFALVLHLPDELEETLLSNRFAQVTVFHHTGYVQTLHHYSAGKHCC